MKYIKYFILFLISSCIDLSPGIQQNWQCYTIKQGKHRSVNKIDNAYSQIKFQADLSDAIYDTTALGVDKYDWNKLYGITSSQIHQDSYRIGFRLLNHQWQFSAYWYKDGKRYSQYLGSCNINDKPVFIIDARDDNTCLFKMDNNNIIID